jgi:lysozyme family protein
MTRQEYAKRISDLLRPEAPGSKLMSEEVGLMDQIAAMWSARGAVATSRFDQALSLVLVHEGGYSNHPSDPGGATMKGVTQAVYDDWRVRQGLGKRSVRDIENGELSAIYRRDYWDRIKGDDLPAGVDYAVFDFAVNSGVNRASRFLQAVAGVTQDGVIGPASIAAVKAKPTQAVIQALCDKRLTFLKGLQTWGTFGKGWGARVAGVRAKALEMAA